MVNLERTNWIVFLIKMPNNLSIETWQREQQKLTPIRHTSIYFRRLSNFLAPLRFRQRTEFHRLRDWLAHSSHSKHAPRRNGPMRKLARHIICNTQRELEFLRFVKHTNSLSMSIMSKLFGMKWNFIMSSYPTKNKMKMLFRRDDSSATILTEQDDLMFVIFTFIDFPNLIRIQRVCVAWKGNIQNKVFYGKIL